MPSTVRRAGATAAYAKAKVSRSSAPVGVPVGSNTPRLNQPEFDSLPQLREGEIKCDKLEDLMWEIRITNAALMLGTVVLWRGIAGLIADLL